MSKRGIYRSDIYWTDMRSVGIEIDHPCLIITNWKNNIKSKYVTVLRLTSQEKTYNATHFELDTKKYNLNKSYSCVLCEEIYTLDKKYLKEKICKLEPLDQLQVDRLLSQHLQLFDGKYNYLNDSDLEELFIEENLVVKYEKEELTKIKCEIYDLLEKDKEYDKCIVRCYEFIDIVNSSTKVNRNDFLFYIYHIMSKCYLRNKDYKSALDKSKLSLKHMNKPTEFSYQYSLILWDVARCYEELKQIDYSKRVYNSLEKYFHTNNYEIMALSIKFNIAKLDNHLNEMMELKQKLMNLEANGTTYFTTSEYKDHILNEMSKEIDTFRRCLNI